MTLVFFLSRIVWGQYSSYFVFKDMYTAYTTGHSGAHSLNATTIAGNDAGQRKHRSGDIGLYYDEAAQKHAFMGEEFLPLWLPLIYLASNLVLNALNVFWFYKMIETIRARFDPPFGTKGKVDEKRVGQWQPADPEERRKAVIERVMGAPIQGQSVDELHQAGKASVAAGRKMAEEALDGGVDVSRGVYADGHKSVEVTGTQRRSARSRRKA